MLENLGLVGLFIGCMLAATVVPFSSETLLAGALLMGYSQWTVVLVATLGNTAGGMISFLLGWLCKWEWLEKYLRVNKEKLMRVHGRVEKYGTAAALLTWQNFYTLYVSGHSHGAGKDKSVVDSVADVLGQVGTVCGRCGAVQPDGMVLISTKKVFPQDIDEE